MNKSELIAAIAEKSGLTQKNAEKALNTALQTIMEVLRDGERVQLIGFGTFESRKHSERTGYNPATREKIKIPAANVPVFKVGKSFKNAVNMVSAINHIKKVK